MTTLFAWVVPAFSEDSPVDHAWVTTYDSRIKPYPDIAAVKNAGECNWYCWGSFHPEGESTAHPGGYIGSLPGDLSLAACLVEPNAPSSGNPPAQGTIFTYGVDGVCHQLANQVLYATRQPGAPPLTVKAARGYAFSSFLYGTYGLQHAAWRRKIASCTGARLPTSIIEGVETMVDDLMDDFEKLAREALAEKPEVLGKLLNLRGQVQAYAAQSTPGIIPPDPAYLNARNQHLIDQAAALLGPDDFRKIFGAEPGTKVNLVDPTVER